MDRATLVKALKFVKEYSGLIYYNNLDLNNFDESSELEELRELFSEWINGRQWTEEQRVLMQKIINAENTFADGSTKHLLDLRKELEELTEKAHEYGPEDFIVERDKLKEKLRRIIQSSENNTFSTSLGDKTKEELLKIIDETNLGKVAGEGINLINIPKRFIIKINIR